MTRPCAVYDNPELAFRDASELLRAADIAAVLLDTLLDAQSAGMFWKDRESRILGCNQKFAEDSGVRSPAELVGKTNFDFYPKTQAEAYRADDLEVINSGQPKLGIEEPLLLPSGKTAWIETNKAPLRNNVGEIIGVLATYCDVTERHNAGDERVRLALELAEARQAARMSLFDALTELPNRRYLQQQLNERLATLSANSNERLAVIAIDLDRFKAFNDLYGHAAGDELLKKVASRLSEEVEPEGFVARLGGDEFILVVPFASQADLSQTLSRLIARFKVPIGLVEYQLSVGAALGVATAPEDGLSADVLMRHADMALYRAKERSGRKVVFFQPEMEAQARERALLERDLRIAIESDQIVPYYQPIWDLRTGLISCYEVLARWPHPERGLVPPHQFIQVAVEAGLIGSLTMNLLRRACREARDWPDAPRIAVNIATVQLRDMTLPQHLLKLLSECGFPPARLEIEVTEEALVGDIATAREILVSLKNLGVRVALDDFGTGYSNLRHLSQLPFDTLKIDQSFVRSMNDSENAFVIVRAIVQLAKNLGLGLVAEGIETGKQVTLLGALGCERGQGYYLGAPSPAVGCKTGRKKTSVPIGQAEPTNAMRHDRETGSKTLRVSVGSSGF